MNLNQYVLRGTSIVVAAFCVAATLGSALAPVARAQQVVTNDPPQYGPYNAVFLPGGEGLKKPLNEHDSVLLAGSPWTLYCWIRSDESFQGPTLVAGVGATTEEYPRYLAVDAGKLLLWMGQDNTLEAAATLAPGKWHLVTATFDGTEFHLYSEDALIGGGKLDLGSVSPVLQMAPAAQPWPDGRHFGGKIA